MDRIKEIEKEITRLRKAKAKADDKWDYDRPFSEYREAMKIYSEPINKLDRERRILMDYSLYEMPDYGDVMSMEDFIDCCNSGGFVDYDGHGNYVKDNKMTNITIFPSDIKANEYRKEFDTIVWFNR